MEATEHTNSSLEDFVKHNGMTDPLAQTTETLKNFYQREKNKEKTWKYIYIVYIKWCYLSHHVFLFFKVFWGMMLGSNTKYEMWLFVLDKESWRLEQKNVNYN